MTGYEKRVRPYLKEIEKWLKGGDTSKEVATKIGIGYSTFRRYANEHAELSEVVKNAENYKQRVIDRAFAEQKQKPLNAMKQKPPPLTTFVKENGKRLDQQGTHRKAFERAKKRVYATQDTCGICGKPVDFKLKHPHPLSACIDHIIPVSKGGHPSDMSNLQLAHFTCNRQKSDKILGNFESKQNNNVLSNRVLPHTTNWANYKADKK